MKTIRIIACVLLLAALAACGLDNTMYNARRYYISAQTKPLNTNGKPNAQAIEEYTKCIQKCGIIISRSKHGARLDDAVFLMAKALYYKGNSAFQAKDQFENLLKGFPDSRYVPESHIFIARILREINQPKEAEKHLDSFIRDPKFVKDHPKALLLLADFAIKDKDYTRAQFWLDKIIREYPKTKEFKEAFFLFGKNYYEQKDFAASREAFNKMRSSRRIDKSMKLDASYYIALNDLELGENENALKEIRNLVKAENRPEKIAMVRLLQGRILMAEKQYDKALEEMDFVTRNYPRTEGAAATYYFLGEYYYYIKSDITQAVTNYNRVRTEYSMSAYATPGQDKATALGFVNPRQNQNVEADLKPFLDYYYQAAESFASTLALPDSALACYRRVMAEKDTLIAVRDSLLISLEAFRVQKDSLALAVAADSVKALTTEVEPAIPDSLKEMATSAVVADSLQALPDSSMASSATEPTPQERKAQLEQVKNQITITDNRVKHIGELLESFDSEITPFCLFAMGSLQHKTTPGGIETDSIMTRLQTDYPQSKYSKALRALINDQPIRLVDPFEEEQEARLDSLLGMIDAQPDSAVVGLDSLAASPILAVKLAANYRLGWFYSFDRPDSARAVPYLHAVLDDPNAGDYSTTIRRFYDGERFLLRSADEADSSKADIQLPEEEKGNTTAAFADSLATEISLPDSLKLTGAEALADSTRDSLQVVPGGSEPENKSPTQEQSGEQQTTPPRPGVIKEEEPKLE